ncbi:MAG: thiamine phosphate synthase [Candidatus Hydrogenedentota bacterium]
MPTHAERMARFNASDLYVVITEAFCAGRDSITVLDAVLEAGVTLIQFREKDWDDGKLHEIGLEYRKRTTDAGAILIVNNRVDIALAIEADGVHLGQGDLPNPVARDLAPELILGASTHSLEDAQRAESEGASYYNIGPIYPTETKQLTMDALGPEMIDTIAPHITLPFTCMGGIKSHNVGDLLSRGAKHPAVVTAVTAADDITGSARELREQILQAVSR